MMELPKNNSSTEVVQKIASESTIDEFSLKGYKKFTPQQPITIENKDLEDKNISSTLNNKLLYLSKESKIKHQNNLSSSDLENLNIKNFTRKEKLFSQYLQHDTEMQSNSYNSGNNMMSFVSAGKRRRRERTSFSKQQLTLLLESYAQQPYPDVSQRLEIAGRICLDESRVQVWFKNRRAKDRKKQIHKSNLSSKDHSNKNHHISSRSRRSNRNIEPKLNQINDNASNTGATNNNLLTNHNIMFSSNANNNFNDPFNNFSISSFEGLLPYGGIIPTSVPMEHIPFYTNSSFDSYGTPNNQYLSSSFNNNWTAPHSVQSSRNYGSNVTQAFIEEKYTSNMVQGDPFSVSQNPKKNYQSSIMNYNVENIPLKTTQGSSLPKLEPLNDGKGRLNDISVRQQNVRRQE